MTCYTCDRGGWCGACPKEYDVSQIVARYDGEADAAFVSLVDIPDGGVEYTVDVGHGVYLDFDADDHLLGIEILGPSAAHRARQAAGKSGVPPVTKHPCRYNPALDECEGTCRGCEGYRP